jgi:hypothetical protein
MKEYIKRWPELEDFLKDVDERINKAMRPANEVILDDVELCALLHMSKRKSAQWREQRQLPFHKLGGKIYYIYSDILVLLHKNRVESDFENKNIL